MGTPKCRGSSCRSVLTTPPQNSRNRACCPMVATRVTWTATSAEAWSKSEGKLESTEQQNTEEVRINASRNMKGNAEKLVPPLWARIKARSASVTTGNTSRVLCLHSTRRGLVLPASNTSRFMIVPLMKLLWASTKFQLVRMVVRNLPPLSNSWQLLQHRSSLATLLHVTTLARSDQQLPGVAGGSCEVRRPNCPKNVTDEFWWRWATQSQQFFATCCTPGTCLISSLVCSLGFECLHDETPASLCTQLQQDW